MNRSPGSGSADHHRHRRAAGAVQPAGAGPPAGGAFLASVDDALVVPPFVLAELDCLVATRIGTDAEVTVLRDLAGGAFVLPDFGVGDLAEAARGIERYAELGIGPAEASIVVLAARMGTRTILTLDGRHFGVLRPLDGGRFKLLP